MSNGLPPGAICNPSYQALTCALSPDPESSNYFFVTDTDLFMLYAETRAGHERNVALVKQHREQEAALGNQYISKPDPHMTTEGTEKVC